MGVFLSLSLLSSFSFLFFYYLFFVKLLTTLLNSRTKTLMSSFLMILTLPILIVLTVLILTTLWHKLWLKCIFSSYYSLFVVTACLNMAHYYMANPVFGKSLCSDWFFLGQDFAVRTVSLETVQYVYFCFGAKPANSKFATKTTKKKSVNNVILHIETIRRN